MHEVIEKGKNDVIVSTENEANYSERLVYDGCHLMVQSFDSIKGPNYAWGF